MVATSDQTYKAQGRLNVAKRIGYFLADLMPKGLYGRALIIIIAPIVLLESILAFVFMEAHYPARR